MTARSTSALILAAVLATVGLVCPRPGTSEPARPVPPAWQLIQQSERSVVRVADAARLSPAGLRAGSPLYAPFWDALEEMDRALAEVRGAVDRRNQRFFSALRGGSRALAQLRVVWSRTGVHEPAVTQALESLGSAFRPLRTHYGPEQARAERGGVLTPQERERFREIQRMQVRFIAVLQPLRAQAASRGDREMTAQVDRLLDRANDIANADLTLDEYLDASLSEDELMGEWDGNGPYVEPTYQSAWHAADAAVEELYVAEEAGFVFSIDLGDPGAKGAAGTLAGVEEPRAPAMEPPAAEPPGVTVYGGAEEEGVLFDDPLFGDSEEADPVEVVEEPAFTEPGAFEQVEDGEAAEEAPAEGQLAAEAAPAEEVIEEVAEEVTEEVVEEGKPEGATPISEEDIPAEDLPIHEDKAATPASPPAKVPEAKAEGERKPPVPPIGVATLASILPL